MCKKKSILKRDTESSIKKKSLEKERFGSGVGWDGSTMAWSDLNCVEVLSRAKAKTIDS